ncbi:MAG: DUF929 family protein [Chloroflexi bacterium]|nr:DUF929 family protein [Chloroflexota bacterium]
MRARTPTRREERLAQGRGRVTRRQQEEAAARQRRIVLVAGTIVVVVVLALAVARFVQSNAATAGAPNSPAPPSLVTQVAGVDAATFDQVGRGSVTVLPTPVRGEIQRGPSGLPLVTYVGAEYCPFCAGERWSLVAALGRFGTFSGLQLSHSATDDVYPNTPTFSFVGSTYTSQYVELSPVELQTNVRSGSSYSALQTPTPAQTSLLQTYDGPPYVPAQSAGSIPFIDIGGQYIVSGASYDVGVLRGMNADQIASALSDPASAQAKAILGGANALTAAICTATGDTPTDVCGQAAVKSLQATLAAAPVP